MRLNQIKLKYLCLVPMVIPLLKPEGIDILYPSVSEVLFEYGLYVDGALILLWFLKSLLIGRRRIPLGFIALCAYVLYLLVVTIKFSGSTYNLASSWVRVLMIGALVYCCASDYESLLKAMNVYLTALLTINLVFVINNPNGMYVSQVYYGFDANWLLGYKSSLQYYVIPAIAISTYFALAKNEIKKLLVTVAICHVETLLERNAMLLVGLILYDILILLLKTNKFIPYKTQMLIVIISNVAFLLYGSFLMSGNGLAKWLISNVMQKTETMLTRIQIWNMAIARMSGHMLFGHGVTSNIERLELIGNHAHVHNQLLQVVFEGGLIGLVLFALLLYLIIRELSIREGPIPQSFGIMLFVTLTMSIFEIFTRAPGSFLWGLILLACYLPTVNEARRRSHTSLRMGGKRWQ